MIYDYLFEIVFHLKVVMHDEYEADELKLKNGS